MDNTKPLRLSLRRHRTKNLWVQHTAPTWGVSTNKSPTGEDRPRKRTAAARHRPTLYSEVHSLRSIQTQKPLETYVSHDPPAPLPFFFRSTLCPRSYRSRSVKTVFFCSAPFKPARTKRRGAERRQEGGPGCDKHNNRAQKKRKNIKKRTRNTKTAAAAEQEPSSFDPPFLPSADCCPSHWGPAPNRVLLLAHRLSHQRLTAVVLLAWAPLSMPCPFPSRRPNKIHHHHPP